MKIKSIAIIGLGLMGGSLAAACRKKFPSAKITGISRSAASLRFAKSKKWIHQAFRNLEEGIRDADLIVICTPVDTFAKTMILIERAAKPGAVVTDVGSVKGLMESWLRKSRFKRVQFIGAHPMVGSHERGPRAAHSDLYQNGLVFMTRSAQTNPKAFLLVQSFWKALCRKVVAVTSNQHDETVAEISHLPHLLAVCLMLGVKIENLAFSGAGFKDTTRIAQGHPSVWLPIFMANQKPILKAVAGFEKQLKRFKSALIKNDQTSLFSMLQKASFTRSQISL